VRLVLVLAAVLVVGAVLFAVADHRTFGTALYWAVTTASTVGYGDVTPDSAWGRVVAVGVMLTAIPLLAVLFADATSAASEIRLRRLMGLGGGRRMRDHVLIIGWNARAEVAARELLDAGIAVCIVADTQTLPLDHANVEFVRGDGDDATTLARAHADKAVSAVVCLEDDGATVMTVIALRHLHPDLPIACVAQSAHARSALTDLGVRAAVPVDELIGHALAKSVEAPHAGELLLRLVDSSSYRVREVAIDASAGGQTLTELRRRSGLPLILGVVHGDEVRIGVHADVPLEVGDRVLVLEAQEGTPTASG
jgi:voltage-gated potassium channel